MSDFLLAVLASVMIAWLFIGVWMMTETDSRGWLADLLFVLLWPLHYYHEIWKDRR